MVAANVNLGDADYLSSGSIPNRVAQRVDDLLPPLEKKPSKGFSHT
jgi:hypothetical protein